MTRRFPIRAALAAALLACIAFACAAPIVPQRSKPGGAARWAAELARQRVAEWAHDAELCQVTGIGVGTDGWLPDRGGTWQLVYWSPQKTADFQVSVDSDGRVRAQERRPVPQRGHSIPATWADSPKVWAATRVHQQGVPLSTFESELGFEADKERFPGEIVWRIRLWLPENTYETHVVNVDGKWLRSE